MTVLAPPANGLRGSICPSGFIVAAGGPGGVRSPCAKECHDLAHRGATLRETTKAALDIWLPYYEKRLPRARHLFCTRLGTRRARDTISRPTTLAG